MSKVENSIRSKFGNYKRTQGANGLEYIVICPTCGKKKLYLNPKKNLWNCYVCDDGGFLNKLLGTKNLGFTATKQEATKAAPVSTETPGMLVPLTDLDSQNAAIQYLVGRNYDPKELNDVYGVRYCSVGRKYGGGIFDTQNTIILPLWMNDTVIGWQSRLLYNPEKLSEDECGIMGFIQDEDGDYVKPPKYFTSPGLSKGRVLYNYDWARQSKVVVVTEGPFDALSVGKNGVATLGKGITEKQARLLMAYWDCAVILMDPGDADKEAASLTSMLHRTIATIPVTLEGYKDPGEAPREEIWRQIHEAAAKQNIDLKKLGVLT